MTRVRGRENIPVEAIPSPATFGGGVIAAVRSHWGRKRALFL